MIHDRLGSALTVDNGIILYGYILENYEFCPGSRLFLIMYPQIKDSTKQIRDSSFIPSWPALIKTKATRDLMTIGIPARRAAVDTKVDVGLIKTALPWVFMYARNTETDVHVLASDFGMGSSDWSLVREFFDKTSRNYPSVKVTIWDAVGK